MCVKPLAFGTADMIGARSTCGRHFSTKCEIAVSAPVLPELTAASARPSRTRSIAMRIDDCFLRRIASRGLSVIVTTSEADTTSRRARRSPAPRSSPPAARCAARAWASSPSTTSRWPTSSSFSDGSAASASSAAGTHSRAPTSPLITSRAMTAIVQR